MKTLYISDLDGTLLNQEAELSDFTVRSLNRQIANGLSFSVATARTQATVVQMLQNVCLNVPIILMNGVAIYDLQKKKYTQTASISPKGRKALFSAIRNHLKSGFLYSIDNGCLSTFYENTDSPAALAFIEERQRKYQKKFTKVTSFLDCADQNIVYYSIDNQKERLQTAYEELRQCPDLHTEFYRDIYNTDHWYLEVSAAGASKRNAVLELKESCGFDRIVSFGDNLNDLPMFEVSDECYAVMNAKEEVKQKATAVLESNQHDGVAKFLLTK